MRIPGAAKCCSYPLKSSSGIGIGERDCAGAEVRHRSSIGEETEKTQTAGDDPVRDDRRGANRKEAAPAREGTCLARNELTCSIVKRQYWRAMSAKQTTVFIASGPVCGTRIEIAVGWTNFDKREHAAELVATINRHSCLSLDLI